MSKELLISFRRNSLVTAAGLIAASSVGVGCRDTIVQTPEPMTPTPVVMPKPQPAETSPWTITPLKPTESPTRTPFPTRTQEPKPIPTATPVPPTPTPEPSPTPTPEVKKTYRMPGESISFPHLIITGSGEPEKRVIFYKVEGADKENLKIDIRLSSNDQTVFQEGSEITIPQRAVNLTTTITPVPGADEVCFESIILEEHSRNPGWTELPIKEVTLIEKLCTPQTLIPLLPNHIPDGIGYSVTSYFPVYNSSLFAAQQFTFGIYEKQCFEAGERHFTSNDKPVNQNQTTITITPNGLATIAMYTVLSYNQKKINPSPVTCPFYIRPFRPPQ